MISMKSIYQRERRIIKIFVDEVIIDIAVADPVNDVKIKGNEN